MRDAAPQIEVEMELQRAGSATGIPIGYRPHLRVGAGEYLGVEVIRSEGSGRAIVRLMYWPQVNYDALTSGASFDVLEGPNVVGRGRVIKGRHAI